MAGSSDSRENPVGVNVVPLVDIIFCLCVFFMCSFKFRQLEGKFDAWLPKTQGPPDKQSPDVVVPSEMRVALFWDEITRTVTRRFGARVVTDDADMERTIVAARDAWAAKGHADAPLTIDADVRVPWSEVTAIVNLARRSDVGKIEFAMGLPPTVRPVRR